MSVIRKTRKRGAEMKKSDTHTHTHTEMNTHTLGSSGAMGDSLESQETSGSGDHVTMCGLSCSRVALLDDLWPHKALQYVRVGGGGGYLAAG